MRIKILQMLRENSGNYTSGEEISRQLAVSRTAIWKHIQSLKREGYDIEAHSRLGYRLCGVPDLLSPEEIKPKLMTKLLGREIRYLNCVDSTNNEAKRLAADGCAEGLIVVAEQQAGGRGRLARGWFSPFGKGIWFSLVLRPRFSPQEAPKCTMMAAVAVTQAIKKVTGIACGIKWPNDILYEGKKLVGILTEMAAEIDVINHVVIGIGVNVNIDAADLPEELGGVATSLQLIGGHAYPRVDLLTAILTELEASYCRVLQEGFEPVLAEWRKASATLGKPVEVSGINRSFAGIALDIDTDGALLVQTDNGTERVLAGDVSIRGR